jgi:hypothetical protein
LRACIEPHGYIIAPHPEDADLFQITHPSFHVRLEALEEILKLEACPLSSCFETFKHYDIEFETQGQYEPLRCLEMAVERLCHEITDLRELAKSHAPANRSQV